MCGPITPTSLVGGMLVTCDSEVGIVEEEEAEKAEREDREIDNDELDDLTDSDDELWNALYCLSKAQ